MRSSAFAGGALNYQEITNENGLLGAEAAWENIIRTIAELGDGLGPLLVQLPPSFAVEGKRVLESSPLALPEVDRATADFAFVSWLGDRRESPARHTRPEKERDDLVWWSDQNNSPSTLARFLQIRRGER